MSEPILTIMIPTTVDRREQFANLINELQRQRMGFRIEGLVEIIWREDNKEISVGLKRQQLLEDAKGEFVVGFDSDDFPAPTYLEDILNSLLSNPEIDHVGFIEDCDIDGAKSRSIFSIKHKSWDEKEEGYDQVRCANPKSVIRRTKALQVGYKDLRWGEDRVFAEAVTPLLESEVFIDKPLYKYIHKSSNPTERYGLDRN